MSSSGISGGVGRPMTARGRAVLSALMFGGLALFLAGCSDEVILEGERFPVRADLEASIPTADHPDPRAPAEGLAAESRPISLPAPVRNAEWAQRGGNARHAAPHAAFTTAPTLAWATRIGHASTTRNRIAAAPVVAGGRIMTMDAFALVSAVSPAGALLWQTDLTPPSARGEKLSGGGLAADGGRVFATTGYGEVVALDGASGRIIWRQRLGALARGAPAVAGDVVYAMGGDGTAWAIDARDGKVIWTVTGTPGDEGFVGTAAPAVGDRAVFFPGDAGDIMAVLRIGGGTRIWRQSLAGKRLGRAYASISDVAGDPVLVNGRIHAGTAAGRTAVLDAGSGERIWSTGEGATGPMVVAGGSLFLLNDEARLVRLDADTGATIWEVALPYFVAQKPKKRRDIFAHYGPVLAGGRLWVASSDGVLRSFLPTNGALVGSFELPGGAATQPAVANGTLYVVSTRGDLLAFR